LGSFLSDSSIGYNSVEERLVLLWQTNNLSLPIFEETALFSRFFMQRSNQNGTLEIDPLCQQLMDRLPAPNTKKELRLALLGIQQNFPEHWQNLLGETPGSNFTLQYQALRGNALELALYQSFLMVDTGDLKSNEAIYLSMLRFQESFIKLNKARDPMSRRDRIVACLSHARDTAVNFNCSKYCQLTARAKEFGSLIFLFLQYSSSIQDWEKTCSFLDRIEINADLRRGFEQMPLPKSDVFSMADVWDLAFQNHAALAYCNTEAKVLLNSIPKVAKKIQWNCKHLQDPLAQFLAVKFTSVVAPAQFGNFEEFRPFVVGDDPALIHHLSSARAGYPVIRKFTEEEGRHLNLVFDVRTLVDRRTALCTNSSLRILIELLCVAYFEGLSVDLCIVGRTPLFYRSSLERSPDRSPNPLFMRKEFWRELLEVAVGASPYLTSEMNLARDIGFNLFAYKQVPIARERLNVFVLDKANVEASLGYLDGLRRQGVLLNLVMPK
jgi:hypothetical protein